MRFIRTDVEIEGGRRLHLYDFPNPADQKQDAVWSGVAESWRRRAEFIESWLEPITTLSNEMLGPGTGRLLDLGCGAMTTPFPEGWKRVGVDLSQEMLRGGTGCVRGVMTRLPFRDQSFGAAASRLSLMFASDPLRAFEEVARVLQHGTKFVFSVWGDAGKNLWASEPAELLKARYGIPAPPPAAPGVFRLADEEEVRGMLKSAGFGDICCNKVAISLLAEISAEAAADAVLALGGPVSAVFGRLSETERAEFRVEMSKRLAAVDRSGAAFVWGAVLKRPIGRL